MFDRLDLILAGQMVGTYLLGTCSSEASVMEWKEIHKDALNHSAFCEGLDSVAIYCESCGWWVEPEEIGTDGQQCADCCAEDEDE